MANEFVLRWGIVSTGLISQDFVTALQSLKSSYHVLQAVGARRVEDAKKFAERFNIASYYGSYDELFQDKEVNVVYVGSINTTHKDLCIRALNAGKHVLCEKPMTLNSKEQEEVLAAAKNNNRFFMEAIWTRFFPVIENIRRELENKTIGDLKFFSGHFIVPIKNVQRVNSKELGGGAILDIGIYPIQLACLMFNHEKPTKITVSGHLNENGVDESCTIILLFSNNRIAQINISTNGTRFGPTFLVGDKGAIQIPENSWCPTQYIVNGVKHEIPMPECAPTNYDNSVGLRFQAEAIRDPISKGLIEHPTVSHDNSRLIMHIIDEAHRQLGYTPSA